MLVSDIIDTAQTMTDSVCDADVWIRYINMALNDLTPVAKILCNKDDVVVALTNGTGTISITDDEDLSDAYDIVNVYAEGNLLRRLSSADTVLTGWKCDNFKITLQKLSGDSVTCNIDYYKRLVHVTDVDNDVEKVTGLPEHYHHLVVLYCVAKAQYYEGALELLNTSVSEYVLGKNAMLTERVWAAEPNNRSLLRATIVGRR